MSTPALITTIVAPNNTNIGWEVVMYTVYLSLAPSAFSRCIAELQSVRSPCVLQGIRPGEEQAWPGPPICGEQPVGGPGQPVRRLRRRHPLPPAGLPRHSRRRPEPAPLLPGPPVCQAACRLHPAGVLPGQRLRLPRRRRGEDALRTGQIRKHLDQTSFCRGGLPARYITFSNTIYNLKEEKSNKLKSHNMFQSVRCDNVGYMLRTAAIITLNFRS